METLLVPPHPSEATLAISLSEKKEECRKMEEMRIIVLLGIQKKNRKMGDALHSAMTAAPPTPSCQSRRGGRRETHAENQETPQRSANRKREGGKERKKDNRRRVLRSDSLEEFIACVADHDLDHDLDPDVSINHRVWRAAS